MGERILVVEDEEIVAAQIRLTLQRHDHRVTCVADGGRVCTGTQVP